MAAPMDPPPGHLQARLALDLEAFERGRICSWLCLSKTGSCSSERTTIVLPGSAASRVEFARQVNGCLPDRR